MWYRKLLWHVASPQSRIGIPAAVGTLLIAAAGVVYFGFTLPMQRMAAEARSVKSGTEPAPRVVARPDIRDKVGLNQFYATLPGQKGLPEQLRKVFEIAKTHKISLDEGSYRLTPPVEGRLGSYELTFPLRGEYPALRGFAADVLAQLPNAALDGFSFQRKKASDPQLEAQVRFTLFWLEGK